MIVEYEANWNQPIQPKFSEHDGKWIPWPTLENQFTYVYGYCLHHNNNIYITSTIHPKNIEQSSAYKTLASSEIIDSKNELLA